MDISVQSGGMYPEWGISCDDAYRMIREAGFDGVDWNIDHDWNRDEIKKGRITPNIFDDSVEGILSHYEEEVGAIRKNGLKIIQAHAPFPPYVKGFPELTDYAIGVYKKCIRLCSQVGCRYLIIHGISLSMTDDTQTPESIRELNLHMYEILIPELAGTQLVICLENSFTGPRGNRMDAFCSRAEEAVWYIDYLNREADGERFGLCLDTGHLNLLGKDQAAYIHTLGKRIRALHLHDNDGLDDLHRAPYTGNINWKAIVGALRDVGYQGSLNFETFRQILPTQIDWEVLPIWLSMIHEIGQQFRNMILA